MLFLDDLLLLPFTGFKAVLRTLVQVAQEQYTDDAPVKQRLLELQVRLDEGEISEAEYVVEEAAILRDLREIQKRKMEMAGVDPEDAAAGGFGGALKEQDLSNATFEVQTYLDETPKTRKK
jgi:hypothetical protein